jgi:predicted GIY-YIG superfamily endonuclease
MAFWTYMLHCRGGYFYVGHTDDLERRIGDHKSGLIPGFTADHQPVELVWSDQFANRDDAKAAERKLKSWSRAKKLALIRGDWDAISALAKKKGSASTSSAWTGEGNGTAPKSDHPEHDEGSSFFLQPHPDTPPSRVRAVEARIWMSDPNEILIQFSVDGAETLSIPAGASPTRCDGLWRTTCFELFLMAADGSYFEFNLSPSTEWAVYAFDSYRDGMTAVSLDIEPHIEFSSSADRFLVECDIDLGQVPNGRLAMALSAVIAETDGTKSYWALAHPPGKPDFHHPTCFAATLPPPSRP